MTTQRETLIDAAIQIGLIALMALWCFQIAAPFIGPIVWAGIIGLFVGAVVMVLGYTLFMAWLKQGMEVSENVSNDN
jgi:ABC-type multidrug transport system permease subunit